MLPNLPVGQEAHVPAGGSAEKGATPEDMRRMLVTVLQKVQQVAEQSGLSFDELLAEASGGSGGAPAPMSQSPMTPAPMV